MLFSRTSCYPEKTGFYKTVNFRNSKLISVIDNTYVYAENIAPKKYNYAQPIFLSNNNY